MGCEAINNYLASQSGHLGPWFYKRLMFGQSPHASLIKKVEYPRGIGYDFKQFTAQRAAPTSILSWTTANSFSADGVETNCGACANSFNEIDVGYTTRTTTLSKYEVKSRQFCVEDIGRTWESRQQLEAIRWALGQWVKLAWDQKYREDVFTSCQHKVVADGSIDGNYTSTGASSYPAACATDVLQSGLLDYWRLRLLRDGAGVGNLVPGSEPILTLFISPEASRSLMVQDSAAREDIRYANPNALLTTLGAKIYRGFSHVTDLFARRFTCSGGTYTEVAPYTSEDSDLGAGAPGKAEINSAYLNAPYEEAVIWHPDLYHCMVPRPENNPGGGTSFDPGSYTGEFKWANIADQDGTNVFNTMGRWYGKMWCAPMKVRPELGVAFVYRRCNSEMAAVPTTCVYS